MKVVCPKHGLQKIRYLSADTNSHSCLVENATAWLVCGCVVELNSDYEQDSRDSYNTKVKCQYCGNGFVPDKYGKCSSCGGTPE